MIEGGQCGNEISAARPTAMIIQTTVSTVHADPRPHEPAT